MKVRDIWSAHEMLRHAEHGYQFFERPDIVGTFDMMNYGKVYLPGRLPDGVDFYDYYVSFTNGRGREKIDLYFDFSPKNNRLELKEFTKPSGKRREDYEEIKIKAMAIILASCVEA